MPPHEPPPSPGQPADHAPLSAPPSPAAGLRGIDTEWVRPDPPPIPERILKEVAATPRGAGWRRAGAARLAAWGDRLPKRLRGVGVLRAVMLVSGLVVVLGVVGLWLGRGPFDGAAQRRWFSLCDHYGRWYGAFAAGIGPGDQEVFERAGLTSVLLEVRAARPMDPRVIADRPGGDLRVLRDDPPASARTERAIRQSREALRAVQRVVETFKQWPVMGELEAQRQTLAVYGFDTASELLHRVLIEAPPYGPPPPGPKLAEMMSVHRWAGQATALLPELDGDVRALASEHDDAVLDLLARTYDAARERRVDAAKADPLVHLQALADRLRTLHAFARRMRRLTESPAWARIDRPAFVREGQAYDLLRRWEGDTSTDGRTVADGRAGPGGRGGRGLMDDEAAGRVFRAWLTEAPTFERVAEDWRVAWARGQREHLGRVATAGAMLEEAGQGQARSLSAGVDRLEAQIGELLASPMISREAGDLDRRRQAIEREVAELREAADRAVRQLEVQRAAEALRSETRLGDRAFASPAVDEVWRVVCDLAADELERDGVVEPARARVGVARERLLGLIDPARARALAPVGALGWEGMDEAGRRLSEALERGLGRARDAGLRAALPARATVEAGAAGQGDLNRVAAVDERAWTESLSRYEALGRQAEAMLEAAEHVQRLWEGWRALEPPAGWEAADGNRPGPGAGAAWAASLDDWRAWEIWSWPGVGDAEADGRQGAADQILGRVESLAAIGRMNEASMLEDLVLVSNEPAHAFAAWRRRGELGWPGGVEALASEKRMQRRLLDLASWRDDRARREALVAELAEARPRRWRAAMRDVEPRDDSVRALGEAAAAWGVDVAGLGPAARWNLRLAELRSTLAEAGGGASAGGDARTLAVAQAFALQTAAEAMPEAAASLLAELREATGRRDVAEAARRVREAVERADYAAGADR